MSPLFKLLGAGVACYVLWALTTGAVYARSRMWGRTFRRNEDPRGYWGAIGAYVVLALALVFLF